MEKHLKFSELKSISFWKGFASKERNSFQTADNNNESNNGNLQKSAKYLWIHGNSKPGCFCCLPNLTSKITFVFISNHVFCMCRELCQWVAVLRPSASYRGVETDSCLSSELMFISKKCLQKEVRNWSEIKCFFSNILNPFENYNFWSNFCEPNPMSVVVNGVDWESV